MYKHEMLCKPSKIIDPEIQISVKAFAEVHAFDVFFFSIWSIVSLANINSQQYSQSFFYACIIAIFAIILHIKMYHNYRKVSQLF